MAASDEKNDKTATEETYVPSQAFLSGSRIDYVAIEEDVVLEVQLFNYNLLDAKASKSAKTPLLFVHGYLDSRFSFLRTIELANITDRVILVPSMRGFGDSQIYPCPTVTTDKSDAKSVGLFTIEQFAKDCIALLKHYGIATADWVGHSMGTMITGFAAASDNLDGAGAAFVNNMILVGNGHRVPTELGAGVWEESLKNMTGSDLSEMREFIKGFQEYDGLYNGFSKELAYQVARESFKVDIVPLKQAWYNVMKLDGSGYIGTIKEKNITIVWGTKDEVFPLEIQNEYVDIVSKDELKNSVKFIKSEGKGHNTQWEAPSEVAKILNEAIGK